MDGASRFEGRRATRDQVGRMMKADRRDAFDRRVRGAKLTDARERRDAETRRMEEYRRLCKREGITSKRLEEFDRRRQEASESVDAAMAAIDDNWRLSNAERKRQKFAVKRKAAQRQSATDVVRTAATAGTVAGKKAGGALSRVEKLQAQRREEREEREAAATQRVEDKAAAQERRQGRNFHFAQRTKAGQPVMSTRVSQLLGKIQKATGRS